MIKLPIINSQNAAYASTYITTLCTHTHYPSIHLRHPLMHDLGVVSSTIVRYSHASQERGWILEIDKTAPPGILACNREVAIIIFEKFRIFLTHLKIEK
jgi:hypothetical protein